MVETDWYTVLGVAPSASDREIRDAYIRISRVVHPDRFDSRQQPVEWRQANEMLKEANRAYDVLRDPVRRADFDASRQVSARERAEPRSSTANTKDYAKSESSTAGPMSGSAPLSSLPMHVQTRLIERQRGIRTDQFHVQTRGIGWNYFWMIVMCGWFWLLFAFAQEDRWDASAILWMTIVTIASAILIGRNIDRVWKWRTSTLKSRLYATPMYIIETSLDHVRWWPLWKLEDLKITHHYTNGGYQHTDLKLVFAENVQQFIIKSKESVEKFLDALRAFDRRSRLAATRNEWDYFVSNDEFHGARSHPPERRRLDRTTSAAYGVPVAVGLMLMLAAYNVNADNLTLAGIPPYTNTSAGSYPEPGYTTSPTPVESSPQPPLEVNARSPFDAPAQPLPANGKVWRKGGGDPLAPLEIRTQGPERHYFVKVVDRNTGAAVAMMFVRGGQSAETLIPLGTYRIRYATGAVWYGQEFLFGPETSYSEAAEEFSFVDEGDQVSGYTLELFLQPDGNLQTNRISPVEW
jgi:hypothetical protein